MNSRFAEEQIVRAPRQAEAGTPVREICRKLQVTETTFYRWRRLYGSLWVSELRELKQLQEENRQRTYAGPGRGHAASPALGLARFRMRGCLRR
jgi:putative transposase